MEKCEKIRDLLYQDQQAPEVREHLAGCEGCSRLAQDLADLQPSLRFRIDIDPRYREARKRMILQRTELLEPEPANFGSLRLIRVSLAAACLLLLFVIPFQKDPGPQQPSTQAKQEVPFELQKVDNAVLLTWKGDPGRQYRIYKGPNPVHMKPVESVNGIQWIDRSADSSPITFYRVESL